jgi:hypothetical protein
MANGCETDLTLPTQCGGCGIVCGGANGTADCVDGACVLSCNTGFGDCDGDPANGCETTVNTASDCGSCGNTCDGPNVVSGSCVAGACKVTCASGFGECNGSMVDGCESDLFTDQTCGSCDGGCTTFCADGTCETCEDTIALDSSDPLDAAKAIGICGGLVSARWALPDGATPPMANPNWPVSYGNLPGFGNNVHPRAGTLLIALSSGAARRPSDPGYQSPGGVPIFNEGFDKAYEANHPAGFPKESPACPGITTGDPHDASGLEVELQVPTWAQGLAFDFNFYTVEWPDFVCTEFNDFFVAMLDPVPAGQTDGNIAFDSQGNPVSVNNALVAVCGCAGGPPCPVQGKQYACERGTAQLANTGFEGHAATGWLTTRAPVEPGDIIKLRFGIYDSGDGVWDSSVLIDNFRWLAIPPEISTNPIE